MNITNKQEIISSFKLSKSITTINYLNWLPEDININDVVNWLNAIYVECNVVDTTLHDLTRIMYPRPSLLELKRRVDLSKEENPEKYECELNTITYSLEQMIIILAVPYQEGFTNEEIDFINSDNAEYAVYVDGFEIEDEDIENEEKD